MAKINGRRRSASQWQALLVQQANGGEAAAAFCSREGVSMASFY